MKHPRLNSQLHCAALRSLHRWLVAFLLLIPSAQFAAVEAPSIPENHLLDQGGVFPEEVARNIATESAEAARDHDVHIYAMTMPSKALMPSRNRATFDETWKAVRVKWLVGKVGAVILFDNEAGWVAIGASEEAKRIFPPEALSAVLRDPQLQSKKKRLPPEQLEGAVSELTQQFIGLQKKIHEGERRRTTRITIGASAGAAVILGAALFIVRKRRVAHDARHRHHHTHHQHCA